MKALCFLIVYIFCLSNSLWCQTFSRQYGSTISTYDGEIAQDIEFINDSLYLFYGRPDGPNGIWKAWVSKMDLNGDLADSVGFCKDTVGMYFTLNACAEVVANDEIIVSGMFAQIFDTLDANYDSHFGAGYLLNSDLDTLWTVTFGEITNYNVSQQVRQCANGDFIFVGFSDINNLNLDVLISRVDSIGNVLWTHTYNTHPGYEDLGYSIEECSDGSFLIGGTTYQNINQFNNHLLMKIDANGALLDYRIYGDWSHYNGWLTLINTSDNNYVYTSTLQLANDTVVYGNIQKINENLDTIWTSKFPIYLDYAYLLSIKELHDGGFVSVGGGYDSLEHEFGNIVKIDSTGHLLWQRQYQLADSLFFVNQLYDVVELNDGYIAACGTTLDLPLRQQYWVIKLDSMGCLVPGCDTLSTGFLLEEKHVGFEVYPNPASSKVNIYFDALTGFSKGAFELIDLQGNVVRKFYTTKADITLILDIDDLSAGIYILNFTNDVGDRVSKKIVVE